MIYSYDDVAVCLYEVALAIYEDLPLIAAMARCI